MRSPCSEAQPLRLSDAGPSSTRGGQPYLRTEHEFSCRGGETTSLFDPGFHLRSLSSMTFSWRPFRGCVFASVKELNRSLE